METDVHGRKRKGLINLERSLLWQRATSSELSVYKGAYLSLTLDLKLALKYSYNRIHTLGITFLVYFNSNLLRTKTVLAEVMN